MKKLITVLSIIALVACALSLVGCKKSVNWKEWEIVPYGDAEDFGVDGYVILDYNVYTEEELVVPGKYKGKPIVFIESRFRNVYSTSIIFSEGIRGIYYVQLSDDLTHVSLPNSLRLLDPNTLKNKPNLSYTVKNGVKYLGNKQNPYVYAAGLADETVTDVVLEEGCTAIGSFSGTNIETFTCSSGVEIVPEEAFRNCQNLTTINFSSNIRWVGARSFISCKNLETVNGMSKIRSFGNEAFAYCTSLKSISLDSAQKIYNDAFACCSSLTEVEIPHTVIEMDYGCFAGCTSLTTARFNATVQTLPERTFYNAPLKDLVIGNAVLEIGKNALYGSSSTLETLKLSDTMTTLPNAFFNGYSKLKSVDLPINLTEIPEECFSYCSALTQITLPNKIRKIGQGAFMGCDQLQSIKIPTLVTQIPSHAFANCSNLSSVVFSKNVEEIGERAFYGCESFRSIVLPEGIRLIEAEAFGYCYFLNKIVLPTTLSHLSYRIFIGCEALTVYCKLRQEGANWHPDWNTEGVPVVLGYREEG